MNDELKNATERLWLPAQHSQGETLVRASDIYVVLTSANALRADLAKAQTDLTNTRRELTRVYNDRYELRKALEKRAVHADGCMAVKVIGRFGSRSGLRWQPGDFQTCDCGLRDGMQMHESGDRPRPYPEGWLAPEEAAKAQARVAELERVARFGLKNLLHSSTCSELQGAQTSPHCTCGLLEARAALASDGTDALAAVRLAQDALRVGIEPGGGCQDPRCTDERCRKGRPLSQAAKALRAAFGDAP